MSRATVRCKSSRTPKNQNLANWSILCDSPTMTQAVADIVHEVESLSAPDKLELGRILFERVFPMSTDDLTDDDFATIAAESFLALDQDEASSQ